MAMRNAESVRSLKQSLEPARNRCEYETSPSDDAEIPVSPRPFIERRRSPQVQSSWPEALNTLQRHLQGFESTCNRLTHSEGIYRSIFDEAPVGIFQISPDGQPIRVNVEMMRILGYESEEEYLAEASEDQTLWFLDPRQLDERDSEVVEGGGPIGMDLQVRCRNGEVKWLHFNLRSRMENDVLLQFDGTAEDATARKRAEIRTELLAYYDLLTGLPNRTLFRDRFKDAIAGVTQSGRQGAMILLEFESFKTINDCMGNEFGDRLLQEIAERTRAEAGETAVVGRLGGSEFGVVLSHYDHLKDVTAVAERILARLSNEYSILGHTLTVFCSMGISMFPANGTDYDMLLKKADVAKCRAKEDGASNFRFFTEELNNRIQERLLLESGLRLALAKKELYLEYQPQVDIRTGAVVGLEALLRWRCPELGLVPPYKFIEIAESSGLIVPVGTWVLREACMQARIWQDRGLPAVPVAVNVSAVQFRQRGFCELVRRTLRDVGLRAEHLELELTESILLTNADLMVSVIAELREMGVKLAIDDFGTGYSSLSYLREFKVNRLKIDQSFVKDVSVDPDNAAITIAIIEMAKAMNLAVLAEGVETEEQLRFLRSQDCETIQGFYFSRPLSGSDVDRHLRAGFQRLLP